MIRHYQTPASGLTGFDFFFAGTLAAAFLCLVPLAIPFWTAPSTTVSVTPLCTAFLTAFSIAFTAFFLAFFFATSVLRSLPVWHVALRALLVVAAFPPSRSRR